MSVNRRMVKLNIRLENRYKRKDGRSGLRLAVHRNGKTLYESLNIYINPDDWDKDKQAIKGAANRAMNAMLQKKKADMEERLLQLQDKGTLRTFSDSQLIKYLLGEDGSERPHYFKEMFDRYLATKSRKRTREIYEATRKKLQAYCDYENITFEEMNVSWLRSFDAWLWESEPSANTRSIHLRNIRTIFNAALDDELITCYPFRRFQIKSQETAKRSLSVEDMRKLLRCTVLPFQEKYRDCFFLSFYLIGINTVDLANLKLDAVKDGRITYIRSKTGKLYNIKVEEEAMNIINKYRGKEHLLTWFDNRKDYRTFVMHYDKQLQRIAQANDLPSVTSYVARHSWASFASELDIPRDVISHALGHHVNVTDTYIRFNYAKVDAANRKVIGYLLGK